MFGAGPPVPVPDVDRTDHLLILGANPLVSNGSLLTAPTCAGGFARSASFGGKIVVIDPPQPPLREASSITSSARARRSLLFSIAVLLAEGLADPGPLADHALGAERIAEVAAPFEPEAASAVWRSRPRRSAAWPASSPPPSARRSMPDRDDRAALRHACRLARRRARTTAASTARAARCSRSRRSASETRPALARWARGQVGRWSSRVGRRPEVFGELPVVRLAEDRHPGRGGQGAGHRRRQPARLDPGRGGARDAVAELEFMVRSTSTSARPPATPT